MTSVLSALSAAVGWSSAAAHDAALQKELRIKSLHIHPIKSCAGSSVQSATIQRAGLAFDRTWLIIDAATRAFCTARGSPHMVRIRPVLDHEGGLLRIYVPNAADAPGAGETEVVVPLTPSDEELRQCELVEDVEIWGYKADGYAVSKEADEALSAFMGKPVRLLRKGPKHRPGGGDDPRGADSETAFQDFHSLTVVSAESLAQVQETLLASVYPEQDSAKALEAYPVSERVDRDFWTPDRLRSLAIERFRINIVLETLPSSSRPALQAWEEDCFTHLEVFRADAADDVDFGAEVKGQGVGIDCNARCARCLVPTVDPETGKRDNAQMPYSLLQKYRQVQPEMKKIGKPCFGMLSSPSQESGELHVGDVVRVTATRDPATRPLTK